MKLIAGVLGVLWSVQAFATADGGGFGDGISEVASSPGVSAQAALYCSNGFIAEDRFLAATWDGESLEVEQHETSFQFDSKDLTFASSIRAKDSFSLVGQNLIIELSAEGEQWEEEAHLLFSYNETTQKALLSVTQFESTESKYFFPISQVLNCERK